MAPKVARTSVPPRNGFHQAFRWLRASEGTLLVSTGCLLAMMLAGCAGPGAVSTGAVSAGAPETDSSGRVREIDGEAWVGQLANFRPQNRRGPTLVGGGGPQEEDELDELDIDELVDELEAGEVEEEIELDEEMDLDLGDGDLELDEALEEEEPEMEADDEPAPPARRPVRRFQGSQRDLIDRLGLSEQARREESQALVRRAREFKDNLELNRAEAALERAITLDQQNDEARRMLGQVRLLLGDPRGGQVELFRDIINQNNVLKDQAKTVIERTYHRARLHEDNEEYQQAIGQYERVIESIRSFPFNLNLEQLLADAEQGRERAAVLKKEKEEAERREFIEMVREQREEERAFQDQYLRNQIRQLRRKAQQAEEARDFERAKTLYERILKVTPRDREVKARLQWIKDRQHTYTMRELILQNIENYETAVVGIEESSIVYQQIFRYPDREEWLRISPKVVSLEEEIAATESVVEKEIKARLSEKRDIILEEDTTLANALLALKEITGINFVLTREGAESEETPVKLAEYTDLPVEDILDLMLDSVGQEAGTPFTYAIKSGAVVIGPTGSVQQKEYLRFYEISDLIKDPPDFPAPELALDEMAGRVGGGAEAILDIGEEEDVTGPLGGEKLLELLQRELAGPDAEFGEIEGINIMAGKLVARTTLENHLKLARLLERFRESTGMMVTVESRFLDLQDNFLEAIGVDFGNTGNSFLPNTIPDLDGAGTSVSPGYEYVNPEGDFNSRVSSLGALTTPLGSQVNPFNLTPDGGGVYQLNVLDPDRFQLEAILTGVAKEQELKKLNSPRVTAFNGQTSHTLIINQSAFIQDLEVNQTGVIPVINPVIGVLNSGSILEVRPTISYDRKYVVLEIQPTLAEKLESEVAVLNLSGNFTVVPVELPVLSVTKIKTTITVPDGGTVLVGGLKREISTKTQIGVPGLLDIPILNLLLGRKGQSTLRSNLFVLIHSKITIVQEEEARLFGAS